MTRINKPNELQEDANKLQDQLNKLQQDMINLTKANNEATSKHNRAIRWLTLAIVVLGILTIWANYKKPAGRYAITSANSDSVYVLDTKTSQLWIRTGSGHSIYLGTNENPTHEEIPIKRKVDKKNK